MDQDRKPERGDLIEIFRDGYQHWAIYVGDGYVIHVVSDSEHASSGSGSVKSGKDGNVTVKKEKLQDVVGNDKYCINNRLDEKYNPRPTEEILQEAEHFAGKEFPYDLLERNCEHLATLLRYGKPHSQQVQNVTDFLTAGLVAAAVVFGILAVANSRKKENQDQ